MLGSSVLLIFVLPIRDVRNKAKNMYACKYPYVCLMYLCKVRKLENLY